VKCLKDDSKGFSLIEILIVIAILGVLASIAIPRYVVYKEQARTASCLANRRNIETDEAAYFAQQKSPSLNISDAYRCPSGGIYVWLATDPDHPTYPEVACSVHYAGSPDAPQLPAEDIAVSLGTPGEEIEKLIDHVLKLDLPDDVEDALMERLVMAKKRYDRGAPKNYKNANRALNWFKNRIKQNRKKIDDDDEAYLKSKADEIQEALRLLQ
jgi:prepilin-type N-terminal cleavage/methylation domain-containing protein